MVKLKDVIIGEEQPFLNCKLGREKYARILTDIVRNYHEGFVLAINGEWGTGKTTFVKMWQQLLKNAGLRTLYFNAWENDFQENPLIALLAEFKNLTGTNSSISFKSLVQKGAVLIKNIGPQMVKSLAESHSVTKGLASFAENLTKGATELLDEELKEYKKKKEGVDKVWMTSKKRYQNLLIQLKVINRLFF
jgi:predicted KAP-like P-loop ATPase